MSSLEDRLAAIAADLSKGIAGPTETVRTLLSWFGAERRGTWVVKQINAALEASELVTQPSFESTWIDGPITFRIKPNNSPGEAPVDPTFRLGRLEAANKAVVSVTPNDTLATAVTLMLTNDFLNFRSWLASEMSKGS